MKQEIKTVVIKLLKDRLEMNFSLVLPLPEVIPGD